MEAVKGALSKANPLNWFKKEDEDKPDVETSMKTGGVVSRNLTANLHKGEIVIDPDSAGPAKDMLLAINEASTYEGIVEAIRKFAPYEALEPKTVIVPGPPSPATQAAGGEDGGRVIPVAMKGGGGADPFEIFYMGS